jgi:hypothetical protein
MAPFLVRHPVQVDQWIRARETALARVLAVESVTRDAFVRCMGLIARAARHVEQVHTGHLAEAARNALILAELPQLERELTIRYERKGSFRWNELLVWAAGQLSCATQEILVTVLLELYPDLVDSIECAAPVNDALTLNPDMSAGELLQLIECNYRWVLEQPAAQRDDDHFFWYRSAEKEEPRLGVRADEAGAERELPLDIARQVLRLHTKLKTEADGARTVAEFVGESPGFRAIVRRIQTLASHAYGEIRHNLLARDMLPVDLMRAKLSMFGASKFDPKSNLWVRVTLYQGAPTLDDLSPEMVDDWAFPCVPGGSEKGSA